jgi:hypothetical protein
MLRCSTGCALSSGHSLSVSSSDIRSCTLAQIYSHPLDVVQDSCIEPPRSGPESPLCPSPAQRGNQMNFAERPLHARTPVNRARIRAVAATPRPLCCYSCRPLRGSVNRAASPASGGSPYPPPSLRLPSSRSSMASTYQLRSFVVMFPSCIPTRRTGRDGCGLSGCGRASPGRR